jgi:hypothetical protein
VVFRGTTMFKAFNSYMYIIEQYVDEVSEFKKIKDKIANIM